MGPVKGQGISRQWKVSSIVCFCISWNLTNLSSFRLLTFFFQIAGSRWSDLKIWLWVRENLRLKKWVRKKLLNLKNVKKKSHCTYFEIFYISEIAKNRWNRIQSSICGSQICDDLSLFDLTRNSEDSHWTGNHNDDKVAVLEFELRKARETIFNLREELTQQTKTRYLHKQNFQLQRLRNEWHIFLITHDCLKCPKFSGTLYSS